MNKVRIFLASSYELRPEREALEQEIYRKSKAWFDENIFLHLDIWEDLSAAMSATSLQDEYNKAVAAADIVIVLVWTKMGMYTDMEFETAYTQFIATKKPFIFTYFKDATGRTVEPSLEEFKEKLKTLKHFKCDFTNADHLWNQFNKELERLAAANFERNDWDTNAHGSAAPASFYEKNIVTNSTITSGGSIIIGDGNSIK